LLLLFEEGIFVSNVMNSPNGLVNVVFVKGPEGLMLELVEELVKK
jgi:hypothetical protein